jgi:formylglycine-generating enzyme required for sulfatase activity
MSGVQLTGASVVMGTPFYMSPEQIRNSRDVDARSDVYSMGVMLYEILTGSVPTGIPKPASQIMSDVPPAMDKIVMKCVDPSPKERYQNATELRRAFLPIRDMLKSGVSLPNQAVTEKKHRPYSTKKVSGALVGLVILGLAIWSLLQAEGYRKEAATMVPPPAPTGTDSTPVSREATFEDYQDLQATLRERANKLAGSVGLTGAVNSGDAFWGQAESSGDMETARLAFQCYLAPLMAQKEALDDMVFVKPGPDPLGRHGGILDAFFVDLHEVTVERYNKFVSQEGAFAPVGGVPDLRDPKYPVRNVTCLEAMAFAAWSGGALPSEAQWSRAAVFDSKEIPWSEDSGLDEDGNFLYNVLLDDTDYYVEPVGAYPDDKSDPGCFDMVGNVSEWTSTCDGSSNAVPDFGSMMVVRGGNFYEELQDPKEGERRMLFQDHVSYVGFRCVREIPASPAAIRAYLGS